VFPAHCQPCKHRANTTHSDHAVSDGSRLPIFCCKTVQETILEGCPSPDFQILRSDLILNSSDTLSSQQSLLPLNLSKSDLSQSFPSLINLFNHSNPSTLLITMSSSQNMLQDKAKALSAQCNEALREIQEHGELILPFPLATRQN